MHELGIASDLFAVVREQARQSGLKKVTVISIKIGEASGIDPDFLRHSFVDHLFAGSIAEEAELKLSEEKLAAVCRDCGKEIELGETPVLSCPACGGFQVEITRGKDVYVETIEGE